MRPCRANALIRAGSNDKNRTGVRHAVYGIEERKYNALVFLWIFFMEYFSALALILLKLKIYQQWLGASPLTVAAIFPPI